jgi:hypothetical protein
MRQAKVADTLIEYCAIFALASLVMDDLLVRVIGAPNTLCRVLWNCGFSNCDRRPLGNEREWRANAITLSVEL